MINEQCSEGIIAGNIIKEQQQKYNDQPGQRRWHTSVVYKSSVIIYGGIPFQEHPDSLNDQSYVYRYNMSSKLWSKATTSFHQNGFNFQYICGHSALISNSTMYVFGGKNYKTGQYIKDLWQLNLQNNIWKRLQSKGHNPSVREHASMAMHQKNLIFLYGGKHCNNILNDMHIYRVENKIWQQIEQNSYDFKISTRLKPGLQFVGDYIYFFGGQRIVTAGDKLKSVFLNDFYQTKVLFKPLAVKPQLWVRQIKTSYGPTPRIGNLCLLNEKYLILWGGQNVRLSNYDSGFWLYSIAQISWTYIKLKTPFMRNVMPGATFCYSNQKCVIYGSYHNASLKSKSGLIMFNAEIKEIQSKIMSAKMIVKNKNKCWECNQIQKSIKKYPFLQYSMVDQQIGQGIQHIFAAFGLLVDNAVILGAKQVRISFDQHLSQKYCIIEDNGNLLKLWEDHKDFINDLSTFKTYVQENIDTLQPYAENVSKKNIIIEQNNEENKDKQNKQISKQQKQQQQRQEKAKQQERQLKKRKQQAKRQDRIRSELRRQYCRNFKLGGLRIGEKVLFVSKPTPQIKRVFVVVKDGNGRYRSYYYIQQKNTIVQNTMQGGKKYIQQQFKAMLKIINQKKDISNNFVVISRLKQVIGQNGTSQPQLKQVKSHGDIFYCQKKQLQTIQDANWTQSIDCSLKAYLSYLYLKQEDIKIYLSVNNHRSIQANNAQLFQKIDGLINSQKLIDLTDAFDVANCKIIQVYYNRAGTGRSYNLSRKTNTTNFFNGVLLYHKNRLISRYQYPLGQLSKLNKLKPKTLQNLLTVFGFIQLKDELIVNIFKTKFVRDDLLYQIYHRLKFIEKYAQKFVKTQSNSRRKLEQPPEFKKKSKPNEQGKSEPNNLIEID